MIPINRGAEPSELKSSRTARLKQAVELFNEHGPASEELRKSLVKGYDHVNVKNTLWRRQHKKCAYCEKHTDYGEQPIEHYRPKAYARRDWQGDAREQDDLRYWWLTWTWENLLFACTTCNGQSHKGNRFPLKRGTEPLPAPQHPASFPLPDEHFELQREQPLLLDPADRSVDPLAHLRWGPIDRGLNPSLWEWAVRGCTPEGRATAKILKLERRADFINAIYKSEVWPRFRREIETQASKKSTPALRAAWDKLTRDLLHPELPFVAARWWMLDTLRSSSTQLQRHALPPPPRPS